MLKTLWMTAAKNLRAFTQPSADEYVCVVIVRRSLSDDAEFTGNKRGAAKGKALAIQLAKELQAGWDSAAIAGHFEVAQILLPEVQS